MNWRRIFAVMAVRVSMIATVLFALMLIRAGALKEKEPKPAIISAGRELEYIQWPSYSVKHIHRLYFFPNEEKEAEAEVEESGNAIVLKKKMYINAMLKEEFEYDTAGNEVKLLSYYDDGSIDTWYENEYDNKGNRIKEVSPARDGDIIHEYVYAHNENGDVLKVCAYVDGSIKVYDEYEYDKGGNCTKHTEYYSDGSIYLWSEFTYDEMGNRTKDIVYNGAGTDNICFWHEYEYDDMGNKTKEIRYSGNSSRISYMREWKYDEKGHLIRSTYYDDDGIIKECHEFVYDGMGNLIKRSKLIKGTGYHFNIFGELFVLKTMEEESVTEYEYEYAYVD